MKTHKLTSSLDKMLEAQCWLSWQIYFYFSSVRLCLR